MMWAGARLMIVVPRMSRLVYVHQALLCHLQCIWVACQMLLFILLMCFQHPAFLLTHTVSHGLSFLACADLIKAVELDSCSHIPCSVVDASKLFCNFTIASHAIVGPSSSLWCVQVPTVLSFLGCVICWTRMMPLPPARWWPLPSLQSRVSRRSWPQTLR